MRRILASAILAVWLIQPAAAQLFNGTNFPPAPPSIPNFGTHDDSVYGSFNQASIVNALLTYVLQNSPVTGFQVDLDSTFSRNSMIDNSSRLVTYGPLQDGFYINHLGFWSELKKGITVFGNARNQDDFNRAGDFKFRDGNLKYDLAYTKTIHRQIAPAFKPNSFGGELNTRNGFPLAFRGDNGALIANSAEIIQLAPVRILSGFDPNEFFFPRIEDVLINQFGYTLNNGLGFRVSNHLLGETGSTFWRSESRSNFFFGPLGLNNNLSVTTAGIDYTSAGNWQLYGATTHRNWQNKAEIRGDITNLHSGVTLPMLRAGTAPGQQPMFAPPTPVCGAPAGPGFCSVPAGTVTAALSAPTGITVYKDEDTFWKTSETGLRLPVTRSVSLSGSWKRWDKTSAGIDTIATFVPSAAAFATAQGGNFVNATLLQPSYVVQQYHGELSWEISQQSGASLTYGHWEERPGEGVDTKGDRTRNNLEAYYQRRFGAHSLSLYGAWEEETFSRFLTLSNDFTIWWPFNPMVNTHVAMGTLGTATYNGTTVTFNPVSGAPIVQAIPGLPPGRFGAGVNLTTYPVSGLVTVPSGTFAGTWPLLGPLGNQSFKSNYYLLRLRANGRILKGLDYNLSVQRDTADQSLFRMDPMDRWRYKASFQWNPSHAFAFTADFLSDENKSNATYIYPFSSREKTLNLYANYTLSDGLSLYGGYRTYSQKMDFTSPVVNTQTANFLGPPRFDSGAVPAGGYQNARPTVGSGNDIGTSAPFARFLTAIPNQEVQVLRDLDQELQVGGNWTTGPWSFQFDYMRSRPRSFQDLFLSNQAFTTTTVNGVPVTFSPNTPEAFSSIVPLVKVMQGVDGRKNVFTLSLSRRLHDGSHFGIKAYFGIFRNLAPRVLAGSNPCAPPPATTANLCPSTIPFGQNLYSFGVSHDNGQVLSTSLFYTKNF